MQSIKCVIVGDCLSGKTCMLEAYINGSMPKSFIPTVYQTYSTQVTVDSESIQLALNDTGGADGYDSLRSVAYPLTDALIISIDLSKPGSQVLGSVRDKWYPEVSHHCPNVPIILVGTKLDQRCNQDIIDAMKQRGETPVTAEQCNQLAKEIKALKYMECSAKTFEGLNEIFEEAVRAGLTSNRRKGKKQRQKYNGDSKKASSFFQSLASGRRHSESSVRTVEDGSVATQDPQASSPLEESNIKSPTSIKAFFRGLRPGKTYRVLKQEMSFEKSYSVQSKSGQSGDVSEIPEAIAQNLEASKVAQSEESAVPGKIEAQPTLTAAKSEGSRNSETISVESVMDQSASEDSDCIISDPEPIVSFRIPASVAKGSVLTLKAVLLGDPAVGKTCLLTAFTEGQCPLDYVPTEADECFASEGTFGDSQLRLRLWDVSCTQLFDTCRPLRYRQITVFILCFSITCPASFENVRTKWCSEVRRHSPDTPIVLVGTKLDLRDDQETLDKLKETGLSPISEPQGKATAKEIGAARYLECSALSQKGIVDVFKEAVLAAVSPSSVALKAHLPAEL